MIKSFYTRYERWWPLVFFLAGFVYDVISLGPIDSWLNIFKQFLYLIAIAALLGYELFQYAGVFQPKARLAKVWRYQEEAVHFLLGSLLSECTLFFFKSASLWSSTVFLAFLALILIFNEFKRLSGGSGVAVRASLFALCLIAFFSYTIPLVLGFVGVFPFLLALAATALFGKGYVVLLKKRLSEKTELVDRQIAAPIAGIMILFALMYFTHLIPPVPVSIQYIGIFHNIEKDAGKYRLSVYEQGESFFQHGEQTFYARPGDKPHCFVRIFAPARFSDRVQLRWLMKDKSGSWQSQDVIPMTISGGRLQGFRGYSYKSNYQPGEWQVRVETTDERELGRIYFEIEAETVNEADSETEAGQREFKYVYQ